MSKQIAVRLERSLSTSLTKSLMRLADGPDEVHKMVLARRELNRWA